MPLRSGEKLGPYEIVEPIGKGGMGEVYRARDSRLGRDVAIKVSAEAFGERFEREARTIASLNHANICTLHDVGPDYLVMELVQGVTLADRIKEGPIPFEESLAIARQIADALEAAHDQGIVHRDLKPGNVIVKQDGTVKVLDFGLAKVAYRAGSAEGSPESSPTMSMAATQAGMILGTAAYMSPEQARGKTVDKRADIWAFGVVLYEMLTGRRLFQGEDLTDTLARVVRDQPEVSNVPSKARRLLERCLEKDPKKRLRDISVAWDLLDPEPVTALAAVPAKSRSNWLAWAVAGTAFAVAAVVTFLWVRTPTPETLSAKFDVSPPPGALFNAPYASTAISPDGRYIVFSAGEQANLGLWLRPLDSLAARLLQGTQGGNHPFWSPDSKSVGFYQGGKLVRSDIVGGAPQVLCDANESVGAAGTWSRDGTILFASTSGLMQVSSSGGVPKPATEPDASRKELVHGFPQFLPDGKRFLYLILGSDPNLNGIYAGSLESPVQRVRILNTTQKAYYAAPRGSQPGYLLWMREQTLLAQPFDAGKLKLAGDAVPVADSVMTLTGTPRTAFWMSDAGILAYRTGSRTAANRVLTWVDRQGKQLNKIGEPQGYGELALSPDGSQVAAFRRDNIGENLWIIDLKRGSSSRLTTDKGNQSYPVWSPDGKQIAFSSNGADSSVFNLYVKAAGVTGQETLLLKSERHKAPLDWSRDGRFLLYSTFLDKNPSDLWVLSLGPGDHTPVKYLATSFNETGARFSPDARWVVYVSNVSSRSEVYVSPFPDAAVAPAVLISTGGGSLPRWRPDGKAIYYLSPDSKLMEVEVTPGSPFKAGVPKVLLDAQGVGGGDQNGWGWDVTPDGQRFLFNRGTDQQGQTPPLTVVTNWQSSLKK
jgi:serine/threonine protein kinase